MAYGCVAASVAGFVQQLAVGYVARGYYFYVFGTIPPDKDPAKTDAKIIAQYGLDMSKWSRARRRKAGEAGVQYLRYERFFVILATHGMHPFFQAEAGQWRDIRKHPLYFMRYSIGCRKARKGGGLHASVRIDRKVFLELKFEFERMALRVPVENLGRALRAIPFELYAPVRDQLRIILRAVNRRRHAAGLELVPSNELRRFRKSVKALSKG